MSSGAEAVGGPGPETIHASRGRLAIQVLALGAGIGVVVWVAFFTPALDVAKGLAYASTRFMILIGALALGVGVLVLTWLVILAKTLYDFAFPHRLVLDGEAVRLVRAGPSGEVIVAHIPYRNVARVSASKVKGVLMLGLHDPEDPDTHISCAEGRRRVAIGLTYRLPGGWEVDVREVVERLRQRCANLLAP